MASSFLINQDTIPNTNASTTPTVLTAEYVLKNPKTIQEMLNEYFKDSPIMIKVAWCESRNRQFEKNGEVFRGIVNNDDVGVMQINTYYHEETAKKMGLDLMTLEGNIAYGKYLYEKEGTTPWDSSSACWAKYETELAKK